MAQGVAGVDHPEDKAVVDVIVPGRGEMLMSWVEEVRDGDIVITAAQNRAGQPVRLDPGERIDLVWKGGEGLRALPVELRSVDRGEKPVWHLLPLGPASRGQRRGAVRTPLRLTVRLTAGRFDLAGTTVDVSESGMRAIFDPPPSDGDGPVEGRTEGDTAPQAKKAALPESGAVVEVVLQVDDDRVASSAEVVRQHPHEAGKYEVSLRFIGLPEYQQDLIRARVFAEMRDLRRRGVL
jgi:hypothetical protein